MKAGMNAFVTKPVEGAELFAAIESVLSTDELEEPLTAFA
jgi:FixJ family two-component response regulator